VTQAIHALQLLEPLYNAITFVMMAFHDLFKKIGMNPAGGWAWGGSIVGLVIVIRILLIPLFVKQINAQRGPSTRARPTRRVGRSSSKR
jgi:YidC/Oxa1 family membrane protein insertase